MSHYFLTTLVLSCLSIGGSCITAPREQNQSFLFSHELEKPGVTTVRFAYALEPHNHIFADTITITLDYQEATIVSWRANEVTQEIIDNKTGQKRPILTGSGSIIISIKPPITCASDRGILTMHFSDA